MIGGPIELAGEGRLPLDHWLAPMSVGITGVILLWLSANTILGKVSKL